MLRRGALAPAYVGRLRYVDASAVVALVEEDALAAHVLGALLENRLRAPRAARSDLPPPSLVSVLDRL